MKNIVYLSQFKDSSGYAVAARGYLLALDEYMKKNENSYTLKAHTLKIEAGKTVSLEEEKLIDSLSFKDEQEADEFIQNEEYILIWHMPPPMILLKDKYKDFDPNWRIAHKLLEGSKRNINVTVWEADAIPETWRRVYDIFETRDVVVPCQWNKQSFEELVEGTNQELSVYKVPHVITEDNRAAKPMDLDLEDKFIFLTMSQWTHRKGFDKLIEAFTMEFSHQEDVKLVIKTYDNIMPSYLEKFPIEKQAENIHNTIQAIRTAVHTPRDSVNEKAIHGPRVNNIDLIPWLLPYEHIQWLYEKANVFCLATRGEGFGLTISEAIMHEKPVIVPNQGGHIDFISDENKDLLFNCYKSPYISMPGYHCDMNWFEPDVISLRQKLRLAYNMWKEDKNTLESIGKKNKRFIVESDEYSKETVGKQMFQSVLSLKQKAVTTSREKINLIKNKHDGEDCVILTCGPSLSNYTKEELLKITEGKTVFAIKQAIEKLPENVDYHFFNCNNFQVYDYKNREKTFIVGSSGESVATTKKYIWSDEQEIDMFLEVQKNYDQNYSDALCNTLDFESYTFDKTMWRPWGPGVMAEVVFYFALHAGFKNIYTIGWDLEKPGSLKSNHFYKDGRELTKPADPMRADEIENNIAMSLELYKWLKSKGVNLFVSSKDSYVHTDVPRKFLLGGGK